MSLIGRIDDFSGESSEWTSYLERFEAYRIANDISDEKCVSAFVTVIGQTTYQLLRNLCEPDKPTNLTFTQLKGKLNEYFTPKPLIIAERFRFHKRDQRSDETIAAYLVELKKLASKCEFGNSLTESLRDCLVCGLTNPQIQKRLLSEENLTLEKAVQLALAMDTASNDTAQLQKQKHGETAHAIKANRNSAKNQPPANKVNNNERKSNNKCHNCGGAYPHKGPCPAKGKVCHKCGKLNHFAKYCRSKDSKVKQISEGEIDYVFTTTESKLNSLPSCQVEIAGVKIKMGIDSQASVNVLDKLAFQKLKDKAGAPENCLRPCSTSLFAYNSKKPLPTLGEIRARVTTDTGNTAETRFCIVDGIGGNLLCYQTSVDLGILHIVNSVESRVFSQHPELFKGIGKINTDPIKLHIDTDVEPKAQKLRPIPFKVRKDVDAEIQRLLEADVIEPVEGPTPWVSPIVTPRKKNGGGVRICVDMREPNKAIKRERFPMPTVDELINALNEATVFSTLDLSAGYHQFELDEESRYITTFTTHRGLYRYKRLLFGVNAASEKFQKAVRQMLAGLAGVINISDDIIVYGKSQHEHDENLQRVFQRLIECGARLNREKCKISQPKVVYYGHTFSAEGISPAPGKISDIQNTKVPKDASEVRSFLGLTQYLARFIPNYASITAPLRELTKKDAKFVWSSSCNQAFEDLKVVLTSETTMTYFDSTKASVLIVDASQFGLSAMLCQNSKVVAYASRAMSAAESRYAQIEREALAIKFGIEQFRVYLYGSHFEVFTDHKPLLPIFNSQGTKANARIELWLLKLQQYDFEVKHIAGKDNPADYLSRYHGHTGHCKTMIEDYVHYVCSNAVPKAMKFELVQSESKCDSEIQALKIALTTGNWSNESVRQFRNLKNEFSVFKGVVLRDTRIVLPQSLREHAIDLAHASHQGIVKTKQLLREKVWFPGIDNAIERKVRGCLTCQIATPTPTPPEPLQMTELPNAPWESVSMDFKGPFAGGEYIMVVVDDYSRYPEAVVVTSLQAKTVIPELDKIFLRHGIPKVVRTDNGPPMNSEDSKFANYLGFTHINYSFVAACQWRG
ncbi:hypothetical protein HOLleu_06562 [Holothuria leucospilota]|uniref:Reverse transcriptase n=1 Tax=Holothuria leucospilota TaxID=206669 RepID=A0A9Q1HJM9_HOLLE|nr:hypothetical protein HOLleu_06562 [Holothuria leucospilota]